MKVKPNFVANLPLLGLSFMLAMALFLFVQMQAAPAKNPVEVTIPTEFQKNSTNLYPVILTPGVKVTVDGPTDQVNQLTSNPKLAAATIDLSGIKAGIHELPFAISHVGGLNGLSIQPLQKFVKVQLFQIIQKKVTVTDVLEHQFPEKDLILDSVELTPSTVTLTGPENLIASATAQVNLDLSEESPNKEVAAKVRVYDKNHAVLNEVTSDPDQVVARFATHVAPDRKQLVINVNFFGNLPANTIMENYYSVPNAITVTGNSKVLATIATASVNVNLDGITQNKILFVKPILPNGVTLVGNKREVEVKLFVRQGDSNQNGASSNGDAGKSAQNSDKKTHSST